MKHVQKPHRGKAKPFLEVLMQLTKLQEKHARTVIEMGGAYLGKLRCKDPAHMVKAGEMVGAYWRFPPKMYPVSFDQGWILSDEKGLLIANKPRGYPTQGRRDADYMAFYELLKQNLKGYVGLHHRLDQDTSGLLIFTRDKALNKPLAEIFQQKKIQKTYWAILTGPWTQESDTAIIDAPIATQQTAKGTRHEFHPSGKTAQTEITRLAEADGLVLAEVKPITGRTHQIRVHSQHIGMPLYGDWLYAQTGEPPFMLHCGRLQWQGSAGLPNGDWHCPPPQDWQSRLPERLNERLLGL
jgi:RluA family pseudouridine synthase